MTKDDQKAAFKKWYEKNKENLSKKRLARYKDDPAYREKYVASAAQRRLNFPAPSSAGQSHFKDVNGRSVEVFRISKVAQQIGIGIQTIRAWEDEKIIPKPIIESAHRYYVKWQVVLMQELADLCHKHRYDRANRASVIAAKSAEIWKGWDQVE